jgi:hypothetical protein
MAMRKLLLIVALGAALCPAAGLAQSVGFRECGIIGTWYGVGDSGTTWWATVTPGSTMIAGQFNMEWVLLEPTLGGFFPDAVRVTGASGVWKQLRHNTYEYTWVAHGLDASGAVVYTARVSGLHTRVDCNHMNINYALELWYGFPDISTEPASFCFPGTATETRMPLVQATCQ